MKLFKKRNPFTRQKVRLGNILKILKKKSENPDSRFSIRFSMKISKSKKYRNYQDFFRFCDFYIFIENREFGFSFFSSRFSKCNFFSSERISIFLKFHKLIFQGDTLISA